MGSTTSSPQVAAVAAHSLSGSSSNTSTLDHTSDTEKLLLGTLGTTSNLFLPLSYPPPQQQQQQQQEQKPLPPPSQPYNTNDPLASHIARDLPRYIVEHRFGTSSGRLIRSYRIRHVDSGALLVLKAMMVRIEIRGGNSSSSSSNTTSSSSSSSGGKAGETQNYPTSTSSTTDGHFDMILQRASSTGSNSTSNTTTNNNNHNHNSSKVYGTMTLQELTWQDEELRNIVALISQVDPTDTTILEHPNIFPYYHWFVSSYGTVISSSATISTRGILPAVSFTNTATTISTHTLSLTTSSNPTHDTQASPTIIEKPIYLLRPHVYSTLYDRIVTRPFLSTCEKMFIAFQILKALQKLHTSTIPRRGGDAKNDTVQIPCCHGQITCENIGLTSWN